MTVVLAPRPATPRGTAIHLARALVAPSRPGAVAPRGRPPPPPRPLTAQPPNHPPARPPARSGRDPCHDAFWAGSVTTVVTDPAQNVARDG